MEAAGFPETSIIHGVTYQKTVSVMVLLLLSPHTSLLLHLILLKEYSPLWTLSSKYSHPPFLTVSDNCLPVSYSHYI